MTDEQRLRFRLHCAVEPWAVEAPQEVLQGVSRFLAGIALAQHPKKIIDEGEELVCALADEVLSYLSFSIGALGARDSN